MIRVVHVQTGLPLSGNAAHRLHQYMLQSGIDSKMLVMNTSVELGNTLFVTSRFKSRIFVRAHNYYSRLIGLFKKKQTYAYSYPICFSHDISDDLNIRNADVIYLHWIVGGFLSLNSIKKIASLKKPIIIFLHDMWPITGGCHHSFDCENYKIACSNCYIFNKTSFFSESQFRRKKSLYGEFPNIVFIAPSIWMQKCAERSGVINGNRIFHIPNLVDDGVFYQRYTTGLKGELGIMENSKVISFGSNSNASVYKGWNFLKEALLLLEKINLEFEIELLIFGTPIDNNDLSDIPFKVHCVGRVNDDNLMAVINSSSDVFVSPSLAESFGLTFLENLLCGTPVVGFDNTGISEIIVHKETGYLARNRSAEDLAEGILYCLKNRMDVRTPKQYLSRNVILDHKKLLDAII